jgi:hypothetical protein
MLSGDFLMTPDYPLDASDDIWMTYWESSDSSAICLFTSDGSTYLKLWLIGTKRAHLISKSYLVVRVNSQPFLHFSTSGMCWPPTSGCVPQLPVVASNFRYVFLCGFIYFAELVNRLFA